MIDTMEIKYGLLEWDKIGTNQRLKKINKIGRLIEQWDYVQVIKMRI